MGNICFIRQKGIMMLMLTFMRLSLIDHNFKRTNQNACIIQLVLKEPIRMFVSFNLSYKSE